MKNKLTTVKQYLEQIPDPAVREKALKNMWSEYGEEWTTSLPKALKRAFLFCRSEEGFCYWNDQYEKLLQLEKEQLPVNLFNVNLYYR